MSSFPISALMPPAKDGFQAEDRKTLTRVELEISHVRDDLTSYGNRITRLEMDHVRISELTELRVDIDGLRDSKLDKSEADAQVARTANELQNTINAAERLAETQAKIMDDFDEDLKDLTKWRWFERGAVVGIITLIEIVAKVFFK